MGFGLSQKWSLMILICLKNIQVGSLAIQKNISHGRNQFVLDFGNPEVVEAIYNQMARLLSTVPIDYIKLDMNRYISESFSSHLPSKQQGEVNHRYILGVYSLYEN